MEAIPVTFDNLPNYVVGGIEKKIFPEASTTTPLTAPSKVPTAALPWAVNPQLGVLFGKLLTSMVGSVPATVVMTPEPSLRTMQLPVSAM